MFFKNVRSALPIARVQSTYVKQVTAAGFQLMYRWYVTDFRDNNKGKGSTANAGIGSSAAAE